MSTVNIRYGLTNQVTRDFDSETTIRELLADRSILAALSAPESVTAVSGGETLSAGDYVSDYVSITLEQQASSKA